MAYLTLEQINYDMTYAPIDFEDEFKNRMKQEIVNYIKRLDTSTPLNTKKTNKNFKICDMNEMVVNHIDYALQQFADDADNCYDIYRKGTNLQYMAYWNTSPKSAQTHNGENHRATLREIFLKKKWNEDYINCLWIH